MNCFFPFKEKPESRKAKSSEEVVIAKEHNLRVFSYSELKTATDNFNSSLKVGEGGFGSVYKATIRHPKGKEGVPTAVAIKRFTGELGSREWLTEVQLLGVVDHPNLVKLLGYCSVVGKRAVHRLFVYEYMPNGSLDYHLFNKASTTLPWTSRLEIILGAAQGLAYLHEGLEIQVIYRDFKPSNVLLDEYFKPKLSDCGLAKKGPTDDCDHVSTSVTGTIGYIAPEYISTGHLSVKCDVYSFGVVLYEILAGRRALDRNLPLDQLLLEWVKLHPADSKGFSTIIDARLENQYSLSAARKIAKLADTCLNKYPKYRPRMSQVVMILKQVMEESGEESFSEKRRSESSASSNLVALNKHSDQMGDIDTSRRMKGFLKPDEQNLYAPDPKSRGEEDSERLQLQVHQYSDPPIGTFGRGSTSGNAPEEGVLSMGELINEMGEAEDEGSLNEVTQSFYEELLEEILLGKLEETPPDQRELEESNCHLLKVPPTISHHFSILCVLDLSSTEINSLPQSISRLVALQKLFLRSCELLMELPPEIGELVNLEVLDLEGTEILCLPKEIAKLVNLTCLKVSFYGYANQTVIPRRVLSNLSILIELIIDVTPFGEWWEVEAIVDDLCSLKELRTLQLYLPTAEPLEELTLIFPGLANFRFTVGRHEEHFISRLPHNVEEEFNNREKLDKGLKYLNGNSIPNGVTEVLKHANAFFLQRHWTAKSLSEFGHKNMTQVKFCLVMECNEFRSIIDSEQFNRGKYDRGESEDFEYFDEANVLGSLERLIIRYMKNMESIWKGPVGKGSLSNLKSFALHTCPNLTSLFTIDMLINLTNLEELIVEDCPKLDSLVSLKSTGSKPGLFLRSLKKISLLELPELASISGSLCIAPNLERMVIFYCPKLEKLSTMEVSSTDLKVIKGEKEWWDALKWYESDLSTEHEDYVARLFIPLKRDGDLMAQLTKD
ncbi:uncharacterized protein LOC131306373 isoform X1 [Rhododendron vialii]|uniref:uncharacterized protein LOC131306373 isoform X1 n=1 Tax=Rhododendron vialii TaxID=182163 RepID=UPI00265DC9C4|nr:uncharacterized protein LOC131306373 isoform X1 [Rhododendron vialii]